MTQHDIFSWPAFGGLTKLPKNIKNLEFSLGVYGQAPDAGSEDRWLAKTDSFNDETKSYTLIKEIPLGKENQPASFLLWKTIDSNHFAIHCYPSHAKDDSGQNRGIEKQFLQWDNSIGLPSIIGRFLLLRHVGKLNNATWWEAGQSDEALWQESDFCIAITNNTNTPSTVKLSHNGLVEIVEQGLQELFQKLDRSTLIEIYQALLADQHYIISTTKPLSALAMAALCLPLSQELADTISIASWLPSSSTGNYDTIINAWNLTFVPPESDLSNEPFSYDKEIHNQASLMANAVLEKNPTLVTYQANSSHKTDQANQQVASMQITLWGSTRSGKTVFLATLYDTTTQHDDWEVYVDTNTEDFNAEHKRKMQADNIFLRPTTKDSIEKLTFEFKNVKKNINVKIIVEDRAGVDLELLKEDEMIKLLTKSDALLILYDSVERDDFDHGERINKLIQRVNRELYNKKGYRKDKRPIAICYTKSDIHITTLSDFGEVLERPHEYVKDKIQPDTHQQIDKYCENYRYFPISSAGVKMEYGTIQPTVFIDEGFQPRIISDRKALNILDPVFWIIEELRADK